MKAILIFTFLLSLSFAQTFESKESKTHLIELFSSEGCSSCPSAERWLNSTKKSAGLWTKFIPIEEHVTYWDDLVWGGSSWKDPFSKKEFTQRQRAYHAKRQKGVYTPQLVISGKVTKNYSLGELSPLKVGVLKAVKNKDMVSVSFKPSTIESKYFCEGSYLVGGINSVVKAGENKGKKLDHEFISLGIKTKEMNSKNGEFVCELKVSDFKPNFTYENKAIAVWVRNSNDNVIQAVGGPVKD